jgi:hypothetical protein
MERWVQGSLFSDDSSLTEKKASKKRSVLGQRLSRQTGWLPVTRDPAVAQSHGEATRIAYDFRLALARSFDRLPTEMQQSIRRAVSPLRRETAA